MTQRAIRISRLTSRLTSRFTSRRTLRPARLAARLAAAFLLGAAALASAHAADPRALPAHDRDDDAFRTGPRDPYTDGARASQHGDGIEDTHGAVNRQTDWMPDGSSHAAALDVPFAGRLAGMDRTGVSAPPDGKHSG
ncbi:MULTISPECIES: hypothetical protein [unclassified Cupriavidus]|uniref:hypothetical protein n=1 Tax=Cupriavidus sp. H19C3 TaxID=3241603 RepID=UPI003BF81F74